MGMFERGQELLEDGCVIEVIRRRLDVLLDEGEKLEEKFLSFLDHFEQRVNGVDG